MGNPNSKFEEEPSKEIEEDSSGAASLPILTPRNPKLEVEEILDPRSPNAEIVRTPIQFLKELPADNSAIENVILVEDPRSPTTEFTRTPIVLETLPDRPHNKILDNARREPFEPTPAKIRPKLLDSTPITSKTENKRKSTVGILETNVDYTETDLDEVIRQKLECSVLEGGDKEAPAEVLGGSPNEKNDCENEDTFPITDVKNFDRKLADLIYEDQNNASLQKITKTKANHSRMPLGVRNSNDAPLKGTSKLKVSDKPLKAQTNSKIPVYKEKRVRGVEQCENTPPRNMLESASLKPKRGQWDADNTIII